MPANSMEEVVFQPSRLDLVGSIEAVRQLQALPHVQRYIVDFSNLKWVEPFGMLYFARQLRTFADERRPARCRAINHEKHGYAAHMGFFQSFGLSFGNSPGAANGSDRYIPMTDLRIRDLHVEAGQGACDVREVIEMRAAEMAAVLARGEAGRVQATLSYSLREILRNVVEHSNADYIWYAAQYWPGNQLVELSILDQGIGVRRSLSRNPHLRIEDDVTAIRLALLPGISGAAYEGRKPTRNDEWANSGYGLFMTSQLCARGGSFMICSGDAALLLERDEETVLPARFAGTALRLGIYVPEIGNLNEMLSAFNKRGEEIAGQNVPAARPSASKSSRMLSNDF